MSKPKPGRASVLVRVLNLKTAVQTTDFADNTDEEGIVAVPAFTFQVKENLPPMREEVPFNPCYP